MPLYHCDECHHEFEGPTAPAPRCDWCGASAHVIKARTELESMIALVDYSGKASVIFDGRAMSKPRCLRPAQCVDAGFGLESCGLCNLSPDAVRKRLDGYVRKWLRNPEFRKTLLRGARRRMPE